MLDPRIYELEISLGDVLLTPHQTRAVLDNFVEVRKEATKWRMTTGRPGRLVLIDHELINQVARFLQ